MRPSAGSVPTSTPAPYVTRSASRTGPGRVRKRGGGARGVRDAAAGQCPTRPGRGLRPVPAAKPRAGVRLHPVGSSGKAKPSARRDVRQGLGAGKSIRWDRRRIPPPQAHPIAPRAGGAIAVSGPPSTRRSHPSARRSTRVNYAPPGKGAPRWRNSPLRHAAAAAWRAEPVRTPFARRPDGPTTPPRPAVYVTRTRSTYRAPDRIA